TKDREKGAGDFIMNKLIKRCADMGVEILTEHSASEFIRDEKGQITGVIADDPGGKTVISCSACLIATGNLAGSPLLEKAVPEYAGAFKRRTPHRLPSSNGDGVIMAEKAGIPVDYDSICVAYLGPMSMPAEPQLMAQEHRGEALNVNLEGKRWCNETFRGEEATWALLRQPKCTYYSIMDSTILNQEPLPPARILKDPMGGRNVGAGVPDPNEKENTERTFGPFGGHFMPRIEPDTEELKRISELKGGHLAIADSLEELAEKLGIDKDEFTATIKRYNSLCAKGHDDDFFKPAKFLMPIEKAPFYAFNFHMATDGAFGGLAVDENMQILGAEGPVKGLYAAGDTTSGRFINQGGEKKQIVNDLAWAFASGYLAGENIGVAIR
ncbi:MAG: FAD-binding protein, partial [Clostridiales bacterium]|nr:FAD-binding protein [Clostridiales bacterium]